MSLHLTRHAAVANQNPHPRLGKFYAAVVSNSPSISGQEVFVRLHEKYFANSTLSSFEALKKSLTETIEYFSQRDGKVDIAALALVDNIAYVASWGEGKVWIKRQEKVMPLAKDGKDSPHILSGALHPDDIFILTTADTDANGFVVKAKEPEPTREVITLRQRLVSVIDTLLTRLPQKSSLRINDPEEDFKVHKQRKYAVVFGIGLIVILGLSVVIGIKRNDYSQKRRVYTEKLDSARQSLEEARSLKDLSQDRARALLLEARSTVSALRSSDIKDPELEIISTSIDDSLGDIAGLYKHSPELFLDLSLVSSQFSVSELISDQNSVLVFDKTAKKLVRIDIDTKKTAVLAGPDVLEGVTSIAAYETRVFALSDKGVRELTKANAQAIPKEWQKDALLFAFAGNLYVLDKDNSQIYRYPGTAGGFGAKANWFATDITVNLASSVSWAIDRSIWVMNDSGRISKFSLGKVDSFAIAAAGVGSISAFYTDEEAEDVYLLDRENKKIVVVDKRGQFRGEYEDDKIKDVTRIIVDIAHKKMILAAGNKLFTLEIKHL